MKPTQGEKLFYLCNYAVLSLAALSCLLPLIHLLALSFSGQHAIASGAVSLWPVEWTWENYSALLRGTAIVSAFKNSVVITATGIVLSMAATILGAYPLSRSYFIGRRALTLAIVFTMLFSGGLIPSFLLVKGLGLLNTYWALWLPGLISTFNMLVLRTFFENIPEELVESARMDGCGEWRLMLQMFLPLSLPAIATLCLFYGVAAWNAFLTVLIYINDTSLYNLSVLVQNMIRSQMLLQEMNYDAELAGAITPEGIKSAGIFVMITPMLAVYPFLQKYFVKGVMLGSIKG